MKADPSIWPSPAFLEEHWAAVALILLFLALAVRHVLLGSSFRALRKLGSVVSREVGRLYLRRFWVGWMVMAVAIAVWVWVLAFGKSWPAFLSRREGALLGGIVLLLGVLLHARALEAAMLHALKGKLETERGF
jgi:hypothetical protein